MSRSRKKYPISGHSCKESEKWDKKFAHKRFRRKNKILLLQDKELHYKLQEISENWTFQKDGKRNWKIHPFFIHYIVSNEFIEKVYRK